MYLRSVTGKLFYLVITAFLVLIMIVTLLLRNMLVSNASAKDPRTAYYVSTTGNDANDGSIGSPFKTLEKARDTVRALKNSAGLPEDGVCIYLRGGKYNLTGSFALTEEDSGEPGKPVVYAAYKDEKVCLTGGVDLDPEGFAHVTDQKILNRLPAGAKNNVLVYDLAAHGIKQYGNIPKNGFGWTKTSIAPELFIDNKPMTLARYPNSGYLSVGDITETGFIPRDYCPDMPKGNPDSDEYVPAEKWMDQSGPIFQYTGDHLDKWAQEPDGWLFGY